MIPLQDLEALRTALSHLGIEPPPHPEPAVQVQPAIEPPAVRPRVTVDTRASDLSDAEDREVVMCLDFGTAMSKAFAVRGTDGKILDLELGRRAGYTEAVHPVPSSVSISSAGKVFLGHEAISQSQQDPTPGRERFHLLKQELSQGPMLDLASTLVSSNINPTAVALSKES